MDLLAVNLQRFSEMGRGQKDRKMRHTHFPHAQFYELVVECHTFNSAVATLQTLYVCPTNFVRCSPSRCTETKNQTGYWPVRTKNQSMQGLWISTSIYWGISRHDARRIHYQTALQLHSDKTLAAVQRRPLNDNTTRPGHWKQLKNNHNHASSKMSRVLLLLRWTTSSCQTSSVSSEMEPTAAVVHKECCYFYGYSKISSCQMP